MISYEIFVTRHAVISALISVRGSEKRKAEGSQKLFLPS